MSAKQTRNTHPFSLNGFLLFAIKLRPRIPGQRLGPNEELVVPAASNVLETTELLFGRIESSSLLGGLFSFDGDVEIRSATVKDCGDDLMRLGGGNGGLDGCVKM